MNLGRFFFNQKLGFFRASCFGYRVKGLSPLLLPLVSLVAIKADFISSITILFVNYGHFRTLSALLISLKCFEIEDKNKNKDLWLQFLLQKRRYAKELRFLRKKSNRRKIKAILWRIFCLQIFLKVLKFLRFFKLRVKRLISAYWLRIPP